ncbi:MAG: hypothetical protein E7167_00785 [Firmicutes bacterium]|nr:hypothetical protein [Bacillota bacterium]
MKDLPSVSAFPIDKKLDNSQERFYGTDNILMPKKPVNVISKINEIFASNNHVYKSRVRIKFKDDIQERTIVGKTTTQLLTLTGEKIKITDIVDIEKI